jgi:peptidoglycan hydrolase-like protein with peptidoglycan-binding domain
MPDFLDRGEPLSRQGVAEAAALLGVQQSIIWTVVTVETAGCGFLRDRRPVVLFERHEFRRRTAGRYDASHPDISGPPGGYGQGGANQYARLDRAVRLDRRAALESTSWGLGQIMGYNAKLAGYPDAASMVEQFCTGEDAQLLGMAHFIRNSKLNLALNRRAWADFARGYNGPAYAKNQYDQKLSDVHARLEARGLPDLSLRAVQLLLLYEGLDPGPVDGFTGPRTRAAIARFRAGNDLGDGETSDDGLLAALMARLPGTTAAQTPPTQTPATQTPVTTPARAPVKEPPLDLRFIQQLLTAVGEDPGAADGIDGPRTRAAIECFEDRVGADVSGQATPALREALIDDVLATVPPTADLVTFAQKTLKARGFDPGPIDGIWGPRSTRAANGLRSKESLPAAKGLDEALLANLLGRRSGPVSRAETTGTEDQ